MGTEEKTEITLQLLKAVVESKKRTLTVQNQAERWCDDNKCQRFRLQTIVTMTEAKRRQEFGCVLSFSAAED